jgi:hypothetical protein
MQRQTAVLNAANGRIAYRFHARDLHLVMGSAAREASVRFRVLIDCSRGAMRLAVTGHIRNLAPGQLAVVTFDGESAEGAIEPVAREIAGRHACVYRERDDVHAVIHTHSPRATSFALAHKPLPVVYEAFLRFGITEEIPVAE